MTTHTNFEAFEIFPRNHESLEDVTKYELSDMEQLMTANYTCPCVVYPFAGDKDEVVHNLKLGLENVLTCIPLLGGETLNEGGRLWGIRKNHEPIQLGVHHLDQDPEFTSYDSLAATGFPAKFFSDNNARLVPPGADVVGFHREDGCPVALFQVNFIKGGIILTMPLHHSYGDAQSINHVFVLWAASASAARDQQPMPTFTPVLDRSYFNSSSVPSGSELEALKSDIEGCTGYTFHPLQENASNQVKTQPAAPPPTSLVMYHFSKSVCEELKRTCQPAPGSGIDFVSSYDVICAATWCAMTRARIPYLNLDLATATTSYAHPVDTRGKFGGGVVPDEYFGDGAVMIATKRILVSELIDGEVGIARGAQLIRRSTQTCTVDTIPNMVNAIHGIRDVEEMRWIWHPENAMGSSLAGMKVMEKYDFGFGLPVSFRVSAVPFDGLLGVLPGNRIGADPGGFDIYLVLEAGCQERVRTDPEFAKYCSVIGA
ncbi:putative trichothecene 3-O-acetyltransferase [Xylariales sp. PMI_506]|nr:putative trichothecene 3-O-acetyltransferase [Xylariales sp. PMI_506]